QKRQGSFGRPASEPEDTGRELFSAGGFYVATTVAGEPLNRLAVNGLGYRSRATVRVTESGLSLCLPGQAAIFIPSDDLLTLERATWTIDRAVERGGLLVVRWRLHGAETPADVDSYLRFSDPADAETFLATASEIQPHRSSEGDHA